MGDASASDNEEDVSEYFGALRMMSDDEMQHIPKIREVIFVNPLQISDATIKSESSRTKSLCDVVFQETEEICDVFIKDGGIASNGAPLNFFINDEETRAVLDSRLNFLKKAKKTKGFNPVGNRDGFLSQDDQLVLDDLMKRVKDESRTRYYDRSQLPEVVVTMKKREIFFYVESTHTDEGVWLEEDSKFFVLPRHIITQIAKLIDQRSMFYFKTCFNGATIYASPWKCNDKYEKAIFLHHFCHIVTQPFGVGQRHLQIELDGYRFGQRNGLYYAFCIVEHFLSNSTCYCMKCINVTMYNNEIRSTRPSSAHKEHPKTGLYYKSPVRKIFNFFIINYKFRKIFGNESGPEWHSVFFFFHFQFSYSKQ